jgi:predicted dehydrogenase
MSNVRVAILGAGGMAGYHARRLKNIPDAEVVAVCDVEPQQVRKFLETNYPGEAHQPAEFTDPARMYAEAKPDAVIIATPHTLHFEHGMQALDAGCHVLMEKPMVTNSDQAHKLAERVRQSGKIFVIGYNTPSTPEFQYLRELIRSGELGRLEMVSGWLLQDWKRGTTGSWRQNPALSGGGQLYDSGAHLLNSLVWSVDQPVQEVHAFIDNQDAPVDINGTLNIRFADGTLASIMIGGNCASSGAGMYLAFEDGRVEIDGWGGTWIKVYRRGEGQVKYPPITGKANVAVDNFIDAIQGRAEPRTSPQNGVNQSELMDAVYESARTGQSVKLRNA